MMPGMPLTGVVASLAMVVASTAGATIIETEFSTLASVEYIRLVIGGGGGGGQADHHLNTGSVASSTFPVFTPPNGAPVDTGGKPAVLAATQPALGFNAVSARGFFANGTDNFLASSTDYAQRATADPGDSVGFNFVLFGGQIGITCYGGQPASIADIVNTCHPSVGTAVEVRAHIVLTGGISRSAHFDAGLRIDVVEDPNGGSRLDISEIGDVVYHLGMSTVDGYPPYVTLDIDAVQGFLDGGVVRDPPQEILLTYELLATVLVVGPETGGLARIADPFALQADPVGYFQSQFPGAPLPGFIAANGPPPDGSAPEPGTLALCLAGIAGYVASRRASPSR